jgi:mechanosensitive ion channel-like protein
MHELIEQALLAPLQLLGQHMLAVLPNVFAMGVLILGGLLAAWLSGLLFERFLRVIGLDRLSSRLGTTAVLLRAGIKTDPSRLIGQMLYWSVALFSFIAGLSALNLAPINQFAQSMLAYVPHLITAGVILLAGYVCSNFASQAILIAAVNAGLPPARLIANCSRWGLQLLAGAMALEQLGIAEHIVVVGFGITWGGLVLASAIAFGLGATDLAKDFLERRMIGRSRTSETDDLRHW